MGAAQGGFASDADEPGPLETLTTKTHGENTTPRRSVLGRAKLLWRFSRPHTLIGTMVSVSAIHALAAPSYSAMATLPFVSCVLTALLPAMLVNVFITGLNQVTDREIDEINKPHLPIAAGELSPRDALVVCYASLCLAAICAVFVATPPLLAVLAGSALIGFAYSAPPFRLKRWPVAAALCIVSIRGALVNAAFYAHAMLRAFPVDGPYSSLAAARTPHEAHLGLVVAFFAIFGVAIALLKDVPDVAGDDRHAIQTMSTRHGRPAVFKFAAGLTAALLFSAAAAFVVAAFSAANALSWTTGLARLAVGLGLAAFAAEAARAVQAVDPHDDRPVAAFYMRLWQMFYFSYLALPFAR